MPDSRGTKVHVRVEGMYEERDVLYIRQGGGRKNTWAGNLGGVSCNLSQQRATLKNHNW